MTPQAAHTPQTAAPAPPPAPDQGSHPGQAPDPGNPGDAAQKHAIAHAVWTDLLWLMPQDRTVTVTVRDGVGRRRARSALQRLIALHTATPPPSRPARFPIHPSEEVAMPDAPGFDEMPLYDVPAAPASVREAASRRRLRGRFLRAGPEAVDDRELLELLLSGHGAIQDAGDLACALLDAFGAAPRVLAARPDRLRTVPGIPEDAIAVLKAAEALAIRMARAEVPETVRPSLGSYDKVIAYCRALAGHREVEEFRIL